MIKKSEALSKIKSFLSKKGQNESIMMSEEMAPYIILAGSQFRTFIADFGRSNLLTLEEKKVWEHMWNTFCIDMGSFGNNIFNLKAGTFNEKHNDGISMSFEKCDVNTDIEGRVDIFYKSPDGSIYINQNHDNRQIFLVFVSNERSYRFNQILDEVKDKTFGVRNTSNKLK